MATIGSPTKDALSGTQLNDEILGVDGDDILLGLDTNNRLDGGNGSDILVGRNGNDTLRSNAGNDILKGKAGNDRLLGGDGNDTLFGGRGSDTLFGNRGNDILRGEAGKDRLIGGDGNDTLFGGRGNDTLFGSRGDDSLNGGNGNDSLFGSSPTNSVGDIDTLTGGAGADKFILGISTNTFYDDGNAATVGKSDYALITDFNTSEDVIQLNGQKSDYILATAPSGLPAGTAIYLDKPSSEPDELIGIVQGSEVLSFERDYFRFTTTTRPEFNLSELNGSNGFVIRGIDAGDRSGYSVRSAGDVNGDGFADIIIGRSPLPDYNGQVVAGESYVVFGKGGSFDANVNLSDLNGSNGFVIKGTDAGDSSSSAGDVNGDGFSDLVLGVPNADADPNSQYSTGKSYVVFGKAEGFDASLNLSDLNGIDGFTINGIGDESIGDFVSSAGDINGDGFDDILIGARFADANGQNFAGKSYVVFGQAEGFGVSLNLSELDGSNGFVINGINAYDGSGSSVSNAGDINGDGFDDFLIGAYDADVNALSLQQSAGKSYVVFGQEKGFSASLNLSDLDGSNGFAINGINAYDFSGFSLSSAGDVNSDGFNDILIGAPFSEPSSAGESYVVFGQQGGFSASFNLSNLDGSNGFVIKGADFTDNSGFSVSSAGDLNSDGFDDILIGARSADPNGQISAGESYVVFGKAEGFDASFNLSDLDSSNGFVINGINVGDYLGSSVSAAGDINGDGFDDLMIGAPDADSNGQDRAGESYVVFGRDFTNSVTNSGTEGDDTLTGTAANDILIGGLGSDILVSDAGEDVLYGGSGNDSLSFNAASRRINGGSGTDTLRIDTNGVNLDLTNISNKITQFELIDITGTGDNSLVFTRLDVLNLSDTTNQLIVNGNAGDAVTSTTQGWALSGTTTVDNIHYRQYNAGAATLLVDADITQTIT